MKTQWIVPLVASLALIAPTAPSFGNPNNPSLNPTINFSDAIESATNDLSEIDQSSVVAQNQRQFVCDTTQAIPRVMIVSVEQGQPQQQPFLSWIPKRFSDTENAKMSCQEAAQKLQMFSDEGTLSNFELTSSTLEEKPVACLQSLDSVDSYIGDCDAEQVLFNLPIIHPRISLYDMLNQDVDTAEHLVGGNAGHGVTRGDFTRPTRFRLGSFLGFW